jgi:hypothetical protein
VVAVFSLLICTLAVHLRLPAERVTATVAADLLDTPPVHLNPKTRITPPELMDA